MSPDTTPAYHPREALHPDEIPRMSWLVYHVPVLAVLILVATQMLLNLPVFRGPRLMAMDACSSLRCFSNLR